MPSQTFLTIADITTAAMEVLEMNLAFSKNVNRQYDNRFKGDGKIGNQANIRIPGWAQATRGKVALPGAYNDSYQTVTVNQVNSSRQFSSSDYALSIDDFKYNVLEPMMANLCATIDGDGLALTNQIWNSTGTPGSGVTFQNFLDGGSVMKQMGVPVTKDWAAILAPASEAKLVGSGLSFFNPEKSISDQYREGNMGFFGGLKFSMDQNVVSHTYGTRSGTVTVGTTAIEGATSLSITGNTGTLAVGDTFTIAGIYAVNSVNRAITPVLQKFVITGGTLTASGGAQTINVSPAISTSGIYPISAYPQATNVITFDGASGAVSSTNIILHPDAFCLAAVDLPDVGNAEKSRRFNSKTLRIPIRFSQWWDGVQDETMWRLDVDYGWSVLRYNHACRVQG